MYKNLFSTEKFHFMSIFSVSPAAGICHKWIIKNSIYPNTHPAKLNPITRTPHGTLNISLKIRGEY